MDIDMNLDDVIVGLDRAVGLSQHPDEHCPKRPVLLAVDQELGERLGGRIPRYEPIASTRSKWGSMRIWSSSARGAGPSASRRLRRRRSSSSDALLGA
jgi:hypothetical protein